MKQIAKLSRSALMGLAALLMVSCALCAIIMVIIPDPDPGAATTVVERSTMTDDTDAITATGERTLQAHPTVTLPAPAPEETTPPTTAARATVTPRSTATPQPTATPNAAATDAARQAATKIAAAQVDLLAEVAYADAIVKISSDYMVALDGIATQSEAASENPYLIMSDEWKITTAVYLAAMRVAGDKVRELKPPARFVAVHADLLEAAGYYDQVVRYYGEGVDEMDAAKLDLAAANMGMGSLAIQQATAKLDALADE